MTDPASLTPSLTSPVGSTSSPSSTSALVYRDFRKFLSARVISFLASQTQSLAIAWQVYETTHRPVDLGYVGLAQFLPAFGFSLLAGQVADRFDRRRLLIVCGTAQVIIAALLFAYSLRPIGHVYPIYALLVLLGTARAFSAPASQAFVPELVPPEGFANAVALLSAGREAATVVGPAVGGALYAWGGGATAVYAVATALVFIGLVLIVAVKPIEIERDRRAVSLDSVLAGLRYVWREKVILGVITLDLFAVLLGGTVALLPVYARDILAIGPSGLGLLRSGPALGAVAMAIWLSRHPLKRRAGPAMLASVVVFGLATILFGLSRHVWLSLAALFVMGAADAISVVVRGTVVQLATPRSLRGRVSAINMLAITASNQLGEFESGLTAEWLGTVAAVVAGGVGACLIVLAWAKAFPALRRVDRLDQVAAGSEEPSAAARPLADARRFEKAAPGSQ